ncbi:hypothetical protein BJV82DRAFT_609633 [Fennellomyces sp. T-0311]|nr:hypothetical protein BJV82DRAFT_609633 [Fennellomyces sp. T-0311]
MLLSSCLCPTQRHVSRKARSLFLSVYNLKTKSITPSTASLSRPFSYNHSDVRKYPISHWTTQCIQLRREVSTWPPAASMATRSAVPFVEEEHDDDILEKLDNPIDILTLIESAEASKQPSEQPRKDVCQQDSYCSIEDFELLVEQRMLPEALHVLCTASRLAQYPSSVRHKLYCLISLLDASDILQLLQPWTHYSSGNNRIWRVIKETFEFWNHDKIVEMIRCCTNNDERLQIHLFGMLVHDYRRATMNMRPLLKAIPRNDPLAIKLFNMALNVCVRKRDTQDIELLLNEMQERKVEFDAASFNILIRSKLKKGKNAMADARLIYDEMREHGIKPTTATFNTLIGYACRFQAWDDLDIWMQRMKDLEVEANTITMRILLDASLTYRDEPRAVTAFKNIASLISVATDEETLNPIIATLLRHKRTETALSLLDKIFVDDRYPPTSYAYNLLIHGLVQKGDLEAAHRVVDKMTSGDDDRIPPPDLVSYTTLIHGYIRRAESQDIDIDTVLQLYQQVRKNGFQVNPKLQTVLLYGIVKSRYVGIEKARALFDMIIAQDDKLENVPEKERLSQIIVYNLMMDGYFVDHHHKQKRYGIAASALEEPRSLLDDAIRKKLDLSTSSLNIWVRGLAVFNNDLAAARAIIKQFGRLGIQPNERTIWYICWTAYIRGRRDKARQWLQEYSKQGHVIRGRGLCYLKERLRI